ncbi:MULTISPECIES: RNA polymerase sigma factor RpoD/SigA [Fusobacterium]|uniref:sigma-70 family RNA polymerase sigma factor n=1 Tax=Fusobacterium TaxID=848 RepID=UPI00102F69A8|nr:RNA polymerase sigma factor RpoD/SigA [Fusobacterium ulcerans]
MLDISEYIKDISLYPLLTPEEERDISVKAKAGDKDAQEKLVTSNLRLVISIARKYTNMGIPILDLIQEGNMGLIKAVEKYEPDKNIRFSTYSTFWIKQSILRYITSSRGLIRFPSYVYDGISRMKKYIQDYKNRYSHVPSLDEICQNLDMRKKEAERYIEVLEKGSSTGEEMYGEIAEYCSSIISDDTFEDKVIAKNSNMDLMKKVNKLPSKEREVLIYRYGLLNEKVLTLGEIGERMNLTKERIRQIQLEAIDRLRETL